LDFEKPKLLGNCHKYNSDYLKNMSEKILKDASNRLERYAWCLTHPWNNKLIYAKTYMTFPMPPTTPGAVENNAVCEVAPSSFEFFRRQTS
jgi:hypothetical protein